MMLGPDRPAKTPQETDAIFDLIVFVPVGLLLAAIYGLFLILLSPVIVPAWIWAKATGRPRDEDFWAHVAVTCLAIIVILVLMNGFEWPSFWTGRWGA